MQQQLQQMLTDLQQTAVSAVPRLLVGLLVFAGLFVAAKLVERLLKAVLVRIKVDSLLEQAGVDKALQRIGIRQSLNLILPRLAYLLLLFLFARSAADAFGSKAISDAIASMFGYLPNVVAAILVFVVGTSVSQFAGRTVTQAAEDSGIEFARSLGSLVSGLILFVVGIMAISQLRIDTNDRIVTICTLSGLALAFGLSISLGTRDITRNVMAGFYARKVFRPGDALEIPRASRRPQGHHRDADAHRARGRPDGRRQQRVSGRDDRSLSLDRFECRMEAAPDEPTGDDSAKNSDRKWTSSELSESR